MLFRIHCARHYAGLSTRRLVTFQFLKIIFYLFSNNSLSTIFFFHFLFLKYLLAHIRLSWLILQFCYLFSLIVYFAVLLFYILGGFLDSIFKYTMQGSISVFIIYCLQALFDSLMVVLLLLNSMLFLFHHGCNIFSYVNYIVFIPSLYYLFSSKSLLVTFLFWSLYLILEIFSNAWLFLSLCLYLSVA